MCGTPVSASASECPGCGEAFSPIEDVVEPEYTEETVVEETDEILIKDDAVPAEEEAGIPACETCGSDLARDGKCPECQPVEKLSKTSDGCPICHSKNYSKESGDLVSCTDCGNVYVMKDFEPIGQNWKWKFWVGLIFILVGNVGIALGSYIHNVLQWPGDIYLGYGMVDRFIGAVGIILFILGLMLFALSFKREREIQCPSCKVVIRESHFEIYEPPEEEEVLPKEVAVKSALDEIGEMMECPSCGAEVSIFDAACGNCGAVFEMEMEASEMEPMAEEPVEPTEPGRLLSASELDEDEMIMESLELETENHLDTNGLGALDELESAFQISMDEGRNCPTCGARVGRGLDTCPGCGENLNGGE